MSRRCEVTGKKRQKGNRVSHAMNHTRVFLEPNLHKKRFWVASQNRWISLKVSGAGIRFIAKNGIDQALMRVEELQAEELE